MDEISEAYLRVANRVIQDMEGLINPTTKEVQ